MTYEGVYLDNIVIKSEKGSDTPDPVIYTKEAGWTLGGAKEQSDGSLKIAK